MHIVTLTKDDLTYLDAGATLLRQAFPQAYASSARQEMETCLQEGKIALGAIEEGQLVGFVGAMPQYGQTGWELHPLVVDPGYRRRGYGRDLCLALEEKVKVKGCLTLFLGSDDEDQSTSLSDTDLYEDTFTKIENIKNYKNHAYEFYMAIGYKIVGVIPDANGRGKPDIWLAKGLMMARQKQPDQGCAQAICLDVFGMQPDQIERFQGGCVNYVYLVHVGGHKYIIRISNDDNSNDEPGYWIKVMKNLDLPIPRIKAEGHHGPFSYMVLDYKRGQELFLVYKDLSPQEKEHLAYEIVDIQKKVSTLKSNPLFGSLTCYGHARGHETWQGVLLENLRRSRQRIQEKALFDLKKVDAVEDLLQNYSSYLCQVKPQAFLDDLTTKNVLVDQGCLSGIIDLDEVCFGDPLYFVALTHMALIFSGEDTLYIEYLMTALGADEVAWEMLHVYSIIFCLDFMSEQGMAFNKDRPAPVDHKAVAILNDIYDDFYTSIKSRSEAYESSLV